MFKSCLSKETHVNTNVLKSLGTDLVWPNGSTLLVYLNADENTRAAFLNYIIQFYVPHANLKIQETRDYSAAHITIDFNDSGSSWSYIGTSSLHAPTYSMQIGDFAQDTILHEWGHAIGWVHEHTHPDKPWRYNEEVVYEALKEIGWTVDEIDINILQARKNDDDTPYDEYSIMHYYLPREWVIPETTFRVNTVLSQQDIFTLKLTYPYPLTDEQLSDTCDGFCHPSETQVERKLWNEDILMSFNPSCTQEQQEMVRAVVRTVYMPYFPYKVHYVPHLQPSHVRVSFGSGRQNKSVCGQQKLVLTSTPNVTLYSQAHIAVVIHHMGHVFGLQDNFLQYNCGDISYTLYEFLQARPLHVDSIMSNQKAFSLQNFYLSEEDKRQLSLLYNQEGETSTSTSSESESTATEEDSDSGGTQNTGVVIGIIVGIIVVIGIAIFIARARK